MKKEEIKEAIEHNYGKIARQAILKAYINNDYQDCYG